MPPVTALDAPRVLGLCGLGQVPPLLFSQCPERIRSCSATRRQVGRAGLTEALRRDAGADSVAFTARTARLTAFETEMVERLDAELPGAWTASQSGWISPGATGW